MVGRQDKRKGLHPALGLQSDHLPNHHPANKNITEQRRPVFRDRGHHIGPAGFRPSAAAQGIVAGREFEIRWLHDTAPIVRLKAHLKRCVPKPGRCAFMRSKIHRRRTTRSCG